MHVMPVFWFLILWYCWIVVVCTRGVQCFESGYLLLYFWAANVCARWVSWVLDQKMKIEELSRWNVKWKFEIEIDAVESEFVNAVHEIMRPGSTTTTLRPKHAAEVSQFSKSANLRCRHPLVRMCSFLGCWRNTADWLYATQSNDYRGQLIPQTAHLNERSSIKGRLTRVLLLLHNSASASALQSHVGQADVCGFTEMRHPPYSPDLAPSDYHLFQN